MNIFCAYGNKLLAHSRQVITDCSAKRLSLFCTIGCRDLYGFRTLTNRICAREDCSNRVPKGNRMLCTDCYQRGNHLTEPEISFHDAETLHWERMERELQRRIEEKIRIYNSKGMTQEELRALVPSLHEKAA